MENPKSPSHRSGPHAFVLRPFVHEDALDHELVDVEMRFLLLRVGDGRAQRLLDVPGRDLGRVPQDGERVIDRLAADEVRDETGFLPRLA